MGELTLKPSLLIWIALLNADLSKGGDYTETNNMPEQIRNLMTSAGYVIHQKYSSLPTRNTNSLRTLQFTGKQRFIHLEFLTKKTGWSLWNNSHFKYVGRNTDQIDLSSPYAVLARYEYYITYSFDF